jgi:hypothetical protein
MPCYPGTNISIRLVPNILEKGQIIVTQGYLEPEGLQLQYRAHSSNTTQHRIGPDTVICPACGLSTGVSSSSPRSKFSEARPFLGHS